MNIALVRKNKCSLSPAERGYRYNSIFFYNSLQKFRNFFVNSNYIGEMENLRRLISEQVKRGELLDQSNLSWSEDTVFMDLTDQIYRLTCIHLDAGRRVTVRKEEISMQDRRKVKGDYIWLTVNPRDGDVDHFVGVCHNFAKLVVNQAIIYVFEQRGESVGDYHGVHMHALIKRAEKPYAMNKAIHRVFDPLCGSDQHIVITYVTLAQCRDKYRYMCGDKRDSKLSKVKNDPEFRAFYSLDPLYQLGDAHEITC